MRAIVVAITAMSLAVLASSPASEAATDRGITCYTRAVNTGDAGDIAACFTRGALVVDVGRRIAGRPAIRAWADGEVVGGRITVLRTVAHNARLSTTTLLVRFAPGGSGGFRAHYRFTTSRGLITRLVLTYA